MKQLKLLEIRLTNFKGVKQFVLTANGENIRVHGDNATGKTTIFDGFIWLLFDKDSQNKKDFSIKSLDDQGNVHHGLDHEVEAAFELNGKKITFRKVYSEKWTKKRGSASKEFTGHTTDYFIDDVPVKKKEYTDKIADIVSEDVFKLLTSSQYFNEQLHWQDRRKILIDVCGDITDEEVIKSDKNLSKLADILNGHCIDDYRKIIASKRKIINQELDRIPIRIDEVNRSMPDVSNLDHREINDEISFLNRQLEEKEDELLRIRNGSEISQQEKTLREIESKIIDFQNKHAASNQDKVKLKQRELYKIQDDIDALNHSINRKNLVIQSNEESIISKNVDRTDLRDKWHEWKEKTFNYEQDTHCPSCGQELPSERLESAKSKALEHFNLEKSKKLEEIQNKGLRLKEQVEELEQVNAELNQEIIKIKSDINNKQEQLQSLKNEVESRQSSTTDINDNPEYQSLLSEKQKVFEAIEELRSSAKDSTDKAREEISNIKSEIDQLSVDKAKFAQIETSKKRIEQLEKEERKLAAEFEKLEEELYLTEEFIRAKVHLLEERINSKFKYARFKLFDTQINDGLKETCETLYMGVPYSSGLNNAAKINVGLDIINTLSQHYGLSAPIFVDNAEAVTKLIDVDSQVISLIVSEQDKKLRVETEAH